MADFTVVTCSCHKKLQISNSVDYFTCKHCGTEFMRREGVIFPVYHHGTMKILNTVVDVPVVALFIVGIGLTIAAFLQTVSTEICLIAIGLFVDVAAPLVIVFRVIENTSCPSCGSVFVKVDKGQEELKRERECRTVWREKKDRFGHVTQRWQEQVSVMTAHYQQNY